MTGQSHFIPRIALSEFNRRRAALRRAVDNGDWAGDPANEAARLWLAIALAAGAGPMLPPDVIAQIEIVRIFPPGRRALPQARDIADRADYLAELARARDAAIERAEGSLDRRRLQLAFDLDALAEALDAPPRAKITPHQERKVA